MPVPSVPSADFNMRRQYTDSAAAERTTVALSTTTAKNATAFTTGKLYLVTADVAWFFNHGAQATVTATTSNFLLSAYQVLEVWVSDTDTDGIAGILSAGTGTMYVQAVR